MYEGEADTYHIAISAEGYIDGELFMEPIAAEQNIDGIVIKLSQSKVGKPNTERVNVTGKVTRDGVPIAGQRIGAWRKRREMDRVNVTVHRGRTVEPSGFEFAATMTRTDGSYEFNLLEPVSWFFVVEDLDNRTTVVGPTKLMKGEMNRSIPLALTESGSIEGKVTNIPYGLAGNVWVVAFSDGVVLREVRVKPDRTFRLDGLPPGKYGLKAGHDDYQDPHIIQEAKREDFAKLAEPWQGAVVVKVELRGKVKDVVVDFSLPGPLVEQPPKP